MEGSEGLAERNESRLEMRASVSGDRPGVKLFMLPLGMNKLEAELMAERMVDSERVVRLGWDDGLLMMGMSKDSTFSVKAGQFALRKFVKVCLGVDWLGEEESESGREMRIGRWSEFKVVRVVHVAVRAMSGVAMEMSGEVGERLSGRRVAELVLRVREEDWVI